MDTLKMWVITLVSVSVICTIIEKFAPEGGLGKYVKLICGLVVTIVIASPVIKLLGGDFKIEEMAWRDYVKLSEKEMEKRISRLEEEESRQLLEIYRQSLMIDIKERLKHEKSFRIIDVDVVLREDYGSSNFSQIRKMYIKVGPDENMGESFGENIRIAVIKELSDLYELQSDQIVIDSSLFDKGG